jgi:hypothetical protein
MPTVIVDTGQALQAEEERYLQALFAAMDELKGDLVRVAGLKTANRWRCAVNKRAEAIYRRLI